MHRTPATSNPAPHEHHTGVTLVEVLMSMMIMAIGVSLVLSLFPISAIRTAQATRMTNAAVLKYNFEAQVQRLPHLVFDPDGDYQFTTRNVTELLEHVNAPEDRNYIVDPAGYYAHLRGGSAESFTQFFGNTAPTTEFTVLPRFEAGLQAGTGLGPAVAAELRGLQQQAAALTGLGDGWTTEFDTVADSLIAGNTAGTFAGVRLPEDFNLSDFPTSEDNTPGLPASIVSPDPETSRVTVFSPNGAFSQSFVLTSITGTGANAGRECLWTEDLNIDGALDTLEDLNSNGVLDERTLPADFQGQVGRVLIQRKRTNDFNWLLTVRRSGDGRAVGVDVVVTHNTSGSVSDERVFTTAINQGFNRNSFILTIPAVSGVDENGEPVEPSIRRGGYVLDVDNARWYRIQDYERLNTAPETIQVTLETAPVEDSPADVGNAIFLPSVVDVFPLGSVDYPDTYPSLSGF